ncbi:MAG: choice-of-anchor B family protein [Oligoflexia bacterium]|nr:choice-of-anchor B family protein [Oligoflexia bacterium]
MMTHLLFFTIMAFAGLGVPEKSNIACTSGFAEEYPCQQMNLLSVMDLSKQGIPGASVGNDIWGWTDPESKREIVIMGLSNKAAVVDVTNPLSPKHLADIPTATSAILWRDIKVYKNHAFIVSEAMGHGMQVVDLKAILNRNSADTLVVQPVAHYRLFGSAHNIAINEDSGFAYAVGTNTCDAGLHVIDIRNPANPQFSTCVDRNIFEGVERKKPIAGGDTYTHDVQCVIYHGTDLRYSGREICVASNADTLNIVDVTDKANPRQISVIAYQGYGYVHQGWLTENHQYYLQGDEMDELKSRENTKTFIFDLTNLEQPRFMNAFHYPTKAVDHNIYVRGNHAFAANYSSGLRVLDVSKISSGKLSEVAYFDIVPETMGNDDREMYGAWSVYPYFASKTIAISGMDKKLYLVRWIGE